MSRPGAHSERRASQVHGRIQWYSARVKDLQGGGPRAQTVRPGVEADEGRPAGAAATVETPHANPLSNDALPARSASRIAVSSSSANAALSAGSIFVRQQAARIGPYQIVCELAVGGMASVSLTLHRSVEGFQKLCAVKRIHPHLARDRGFIEMFADEAQIAASINHPYVCSVFSFGRTQNTYFIAMEFLQGESLAALFRRVAGSPELGDEPRFPLIVARLLSNLAEGLHAAHTLRDDRGAPMDVVHRDVTPQNLFALFDGSVRVTDFGIARARMRLHETGGQVLKGKLAYLAPEVLNRAPPNAQVDVWGLGVVLWELLAGRRLFSGSSEGETVMLVLSHTVPRPSEFRANVPAELDRIVLRALERDPKRRYRTARELAGDLEGFLGASGDPVPAMDISEWMARIFPDGIQRIQGLRELAAHALAMTADEVFGPISSSPPTRARGEPCSASGLAVAPSILGPPSPKRFSDQEVSSPPTPLPSPAPPRGTGSPSSAGWRTEHRSPQPATSRRWPFWVVVLGFVGALGTGVAWPKLKQCCEWLLPAVQDSQINPSGRGLAADIKAISPNTSAASATITPALPTGEIYVTTPGDVAEVWANGTNLGHTPGRFRLSAGRKELQLRARNGTWRTLSVDVEVGLSTPVNAPLAP